MAHPFGTDEMNVDPTRAAEMIGEGVQLIDVRETYEHEAGRIEGARHIELERLASQAETIAKDEPVLFYCRLGARSAMAAQAFRGAGYEAYTMTGGLTRWDEEGRPLDPPEGTVADH